MGYTIFRQTHVFAPPSLYQAIAVTLLQRMSMSSWVICGMGANFFLGGLSQPRWSDKGKIWKDCLALFIFFILFPLFKFFKRFKSEVICIGNEQFCLELILIHWVLFFDATQWQSLKSFKAFKAFKAVNTKRRGLDCIDASQKVGEAMARCDFLLIPVLSTTNGRPLGDLGHPR